jgi:8-oxo-dGTP pyrophosphatase MutT (NUDIX family)
MMHGRVGRDIIANDRANNQIDPDMLQLAALLNPVPLSLRADQGRPAAVLVGLQQQAAGWHVVMTRRAGHLAHHAGQISFPGGKVDPDDASLVATALREAQEEIALSPAAVTIIGGLDIVASPVGFVVQPVVGLIAPEADFAAAPDEVDEVLVLPLADVLDTTRHRRESYLREGVRREVWVIDHADHYLWGLSASILVDFAGRRR